MVPGALTRASAPAALLCLALALALPACVPEGAAPGAGPRTLPTGHGVQLESVRLTAGRQMVDVRFRITDPDQAATLFARDRAAALIDPRDGGRLQVQSSPFTGPMRPRGTPQAGRTYFVLFANRGGRLAPGDRVDLELGPLQARNLVVQ
ncbi:MAG TPA: hypothetical protein PK668_21865 [Myxococcota bacterium]|nr:hypothetical protein [Myxococcota bacterium]HRY96378.1 hypothetical protein [Myxococcota bacterium]HSA20817.1 hypothetical protein [Myxococcota bacterium]